VSPGQESTRNMSTPPTPIARTGWESIVDLALAEDSGTGDITSLAVIPAGARAEGAIFAKQAGVISGLEPAGFVFSRIDPAITYQPKVDDGDEIAVGDTVATVSGPARSVLTGERVALNLLQRLSGVATITRAYVRAVEGTNAQIVDTRKTTPGMRLLEKAAVRHGGGANHRFGLADGVLIKDNHLAAVGAPGSDRVCRAVRLARERAPHTLRIEVEVTTLAEVEEAVAARADVIMLDNMDPATMQRAVELVNGRAILEASGGITLATVRAVAETGVDLISVGALTHSAPSIDLSLEFTIAVP
jgi:nicotinate-nucleotide pyrophosphorylase (carboxylating)